MLSEQGFLELLKIFPHVSSELFEELCMYERLLRQWQIHINLVANSTLSDFWTRHILDSAQLLLLESKAEIWLDLGSGAGFPGIVIALFLKREEKRSIHLIESNAKKASFLHTVITKLSLPAKV
jgi:16S rRNA (guanine527-N7)-methyltransferase